MHMAKSRMLPAAVAIVLLAAAAAGAQGSPDLKASFSPRSINAVPCEGIVWSLRISAPGSGNVSISVTGVPGDWLSYPERASVRGDGEVGIMLNPKEGGFYTLMAEVSRGSETTVARGELWVAREGPYAPGEKQSSSSGGPGTGMFALSGADIGLIVSVAVVCIAALTVFLGLWLHREEPGYV